LTRDFVDGNNDTYVYEKHSHGTYVLSTMAIIDNGNYVGTAPHAKYALIRTEDGATEYIFEEYCWVAGAELADSIGADLINSSLGYTVFDDPLMNHDWSQLNGKTSVASRAATIAARKGIICTISAGNWGSDTWRKIGVPADADSVLTVGAVDSQGNYAFFSSQGYTADGRVKPDVCAQGLGVATATSSGIYSTASGTSFSSPILCGVTACLLQAFPTKSNMEIIEAIKKSAHQYLYPDSLLGYGIPNFQLAYYILTNIGLNNVDESLFSLSPNPTTDFLNVTFNVPLFSSVQYQIFDTNCKILKEETILISNKKNIIIDVSNFKAGIYLLKVVLNEKQFSKIFVKLL
jgi:subtilisin family serine protease